MIYREFVLSKTGEKIPLFNNSTPMHSKYNPQREAENFANQLVTDGIKSAFFVIGGIGGGFHIEALVKKLSSLNIVYFILAFEESQDEIDFLMDSPLIAELLKNDKIIFCNSSDLSELLKEKYMPVFYEKFLFICQNAWENFHKNNNSTLKDIQIKIEQTLDIISSDYSVMCHFGKLWQKNIFKNLQQLKNSTSISDFLKNKNIADLTKKTAAIIAAGPSLDKSIQKLKSNLNEYVIISSDTAYPVLLKNNIHPDFVLTIDAQDISKTHYYTNQEELTDGTCFILELSSTPSIQRRVKNFKNSNVIFTINSHPLEQFALAQYNVPQIFSGAGTVTVSAIDFANQMGFKKIELFGADFCYNSGKPYCKGTYLDTNLVMNSSRFCTTEFLFTRLMFRTEIYPVKFTKNDNKKAEYNCIYTEHNFSGQNLTNPFSSPVMEKYRKSVIDYGLKNNFKIEQNILTKNESSVKINNPEKLNIKDFKIKNFLQNYQKESDNQKSPVNLPYKAYLCYNKLL